jgi:hypothetical protein
MFKGYADSNWLSVRDDTRLSIDDPVWDVTVFTKNRERLLKGEVAQGFFHAVGCVVFTAQHRLANVYPSPPSTFQGQDQLEVFKTVSKWSGYPRPTHLTPTFFRILLSTL